ncbi:MAG: hypothetical protein ACT4OY_01080 [Alphaproteobacteria bacterium]
MTPENMRLTRIEECQRDLEFAVSVKNQHNYKLLNLGNHFASAATTFCISFALSNQEGNAQWLIAGLLSIATSVGFKFAAHRAREGDIGEIEEAENNLLAAYYEPFLLD